MANTKVTTRVIADDAITSDKLASGLTLGGDTTLSGHLDLADDKNIQLGASGDLRLFHQNSSSLNYIQSFTSGELRLESNGNTTIRTNNGDDMAVFTKNGAVTLYHDDSAKIATASGGVTITGTATATTFAGELSGTIASATTGTTQSASDNSTKLATTAYVTTAISNLVDSSPSALNTLNELAAALGDDANFSTTVTNSIATKAALAGATFTGNVTVPYLATTSYIDLNNSGNRGKIGWSGNHTYVATTSSVGSIIFKNNVGSTDAPQTSGDTLLTLADGGNATFAGGVTTDNITSGPILINSNSSAFGGSSVQGFNTDFLVDSGQGYTRHNSYHTGGSNHQFLVNNTSSTSNDIAMEIAKDKSVKINGNLKTSDIIASGSGGLALQTDEGTKRIFINDNGNVAIGTASLANAQLHVAADTGNSVSAVMRLRGSNSTARTTRLQFEDYSGVIADGLIDFVIPTAGSTTGAYLGLGYNSSSQLKLSNGSSEFSGYLGIGGTPTNPVQVFGGSNDSRIHFTNNASGNAYADGFWVGMDSTQAYLLQRENQPISFFTNATKRMSLDASGDVSISDNTVSTGIGHFENTGITSTTGSNAGWTITTNTGTYNDRGSLEVAGISNRHVFKWGFSGDLSANVWYQFAKRSELATYGPDSGGTSESGFAMYFRVYTYTSTSGWGEYLANRVTNMCWISNYGSNSTQEHEFIVGPGMGHAPNAGQVVDTPSSNAIRMRIHHRMGSNDNPNSDQTFEIRVNNALTGLNPAVQGRQLLIYGYIV